ncbi:5'-AMP-activated protein kinase subunit gamma-1 [Phytophthora pseudosyringae]|uniref:5'-AMP-activated protein kinase subunit gamma-1 n=1 Tax=Phytophthora pseudosyringae TaxID=221518 RepID=A0A8T1VAP2_9STRA|nr:5'-AMP-activated protein kinase subunit gamma-1 [Phytophthora pseudosyringae]
MTSNADSLRLSSPVNARHVCWVSKRQSFGQFQRDLGDVLTRGFQLCQIFAGSKAKKEVFVVERRRLRQLLKRLTKNMMTMTRLQSQCYGHPVSVVALSILTRVSQKIKRDEAAFTSLADAVAQGLHY